MTPFRHAWPLALASLWSAAAPAQDDLGLGDTAAHSAHETAQGGWSPFLDALLRFERTTDMPGRNDDLERVRLRLRGGVVYTHPAGWEFGAGLEAQVASSSNDFTRANNDNERSDQVLLDQLYARYAFNEFTALSVGKTTLALDLTPLTWDQDLRPIGVGLSHSAALGESGLHGWRFDLGAYTPDHLYDDDARLAALRLALDFNTGAPQSAGVQLAYLHFSDLQRLVDGGLGRTNRRINAGGRPTLLSDYHLLDLIARGRVEWIGQPLELTLDYVHNLGADDQDAAGRASLVWGAAADGGWELGFAWQRMQRDAVLAAYSEDDWWFHSFARGGMPWIGYGFDAHWQVRLAAFRERRDGVAAHTDRVLLDVTGKW